MLSFTLFAEEIAGRVVRVVDDDTITILVSRDMRSVASETVGSAPRADRAEKHKIRLHGIDAPEKKQSFGNASRKFLSGLVANREVRVTYTRRDRYGRIVGIVFRDGCDINLEMLKTGLAWYYKRYDSTPAYAQASRSPRRETRPLARQESDQSV